MQPFDSGALYAAASYNYNSYNTWEPKLSACSSLAASKNILPPWNPHPHHLTSLSNPHLPTPACMVPTPQQMCFTGATNHFMSGLASSSSSLLTGNSSPLTPPCPPYNTPSRPYIPYHQNSSLIPLATSSTGNSSSNSSNSSSNSLAALRLKAKQHSSSSNTPAFPYPMSACQYATTGLLP